MFKAPNRNNFILNRTHHFVYCGFPKKKNRSNMFIKYSNVLHYSIQKNNEEKEKKVTLMPKYNII